MEEKLGSIFTCQRSDTGLFSRCICICRRTQRRERLVFLFLLLPAELIILLVELYLYAGCGLLTGYSKGRAAAYAITANLASAVLGYYLAEPVWRLVVSIL